MRLNRLDLTRYGKFTDQVVDFSQAKAGEPDLHVIYGPNEAGKSTLFNAWLDLLFGMPAQSSYNFLHPYPAMRLGASIELDGGAQELVRIKRPQNSLLDAREQPVSEAHLLADLGGLTRETYQAMFSLDDETLEKGGEAILASRGDLGELLFSASAGLGELSQQLARIRSQTDEFYRYRARSGQLAELKTRLSELKTERERLDTQASEFARLTKAHADAAARHAEASGERRRITTQITAISAILATLPRFAELADLEQKLELLGNVPEAAPGWRGEIAKLREDEATLAAGGAALEQEIQRLKAELQATGSDDPLMAMQGRLSDLDTRRARHATAEEDIPKLQLALGEAEAAINQVLAELGQSGEAKPERLLLDANIIAALAELIAARAELDARLAAARKEAAEARSGLEEARAALPPAAALPSTADAAAKQPAAATPGNRQAMIAPLARRVGAARHEDHGLRLRAAEQALGPARDKRDARLAALAPWRGEIAELQAMTPPDPEILQGWKTETEDMARKSARLEDTIDGLERALRRLQAEGAAITQSGRLVPEDESRSLRAARDAAWAQHKSTLDGRSADAFEAAMEAYDRASDMMAAHHADGARLRDNAVQAAVARADLDSARTGRETLEKAYAAFRQHKAAVIAKLAPELDPDMAPAALENWLARRDQALEAEQQCHDLSRQIETASRDRRDSTARLARALAALEPQSPGEDDFDSLLAAAEDLIDRETRLGALRQTVEARERDLKRREQELQLAEEDAQAWMLAWKNACSRCWLGEQDRAPTPAQVRGSLDLLAELGPLVRQRAGLADRIAKMKRDQSDYSAAVRSLAADIGLETGDDGISGLARRLAALFAQAQQTRTRRQALAEQIEQAETRAREHRQMRAVHDQKASGMLGALGADTLADAALRVEQALERQQLMGRIDSLGGQIRQALGVATLEEAQAQVTEADPSLLQARKLEHEARLEELDAEVQQLFAARTRAAEALDAIGGDDAVARIEQQRQTLLVEIEDRAIHYLRLSAGVIAMEQALSLYRERHRSTMMARASEAIKTISRGHYTGLVAQPDRDREVLIATTRDGGSKQATDMSKGARFQLYLALRVAGYHEFAASRRTVPFIADDIMETFDDFRAEEAFRLFADMAHVGQVIYLTHHRHLCDIAKAICPGVTIHQLSA